MQWATAVHACPVAHKAAPMAVMPDMPGCPMQTTDTGPMDAGSLQQCKAHCERASQALNSVQGVDVDVQPALWALADWRPVLCAVPTAGRVESIVRSGAAPPGSPPLYLTLRVLRN